MAGAMEAEARLRRSLAGLKQQVTDLVDATRREEPSFEDTLRSAMERIKKLLGLS